MLIIKCKYRWIYLDPSYRPQLIYFEKYHYFSPLDGSAALGFWGLTFWCGRLSTELTKLYCSSCKYSSNLLWYSPVGSHFSRNALYCVGYFSYSRRITFNAFSFWFGEHRLHFVLNASGKIPKRDKISH